MDGQKIGQHRFELQTAGDGQAWQVRSQASYEVRLLGIRVYTYQHEANEQWQGGCLRRLTARTDDNGKPSGLRFEPDGAQWQIVREGGEGTAPRRDPARGCLMSYAYWWTALRQQTRLLNPQTGELDEVRFSAAGTQALPVAGRTEEAQGWRLTTPQSSVVVWWLPDGRWVGLDATVAGGRTLRYRLQG